MTAPETLLAARELAARARAAGKALAVCTAEQRTRMLQAFAAELSSPAVASAVAAANEADMAKARAAGTPAALLDRLRLDDQRLAALAAAVREIAEQADPVGEVVERTARPNGLEVTRVRAPLGSVLMIYEARPNVTADAAALCVRSGNAALLRGGSEALQSNSVLVEAAQRALEAVGLPGDAVQLVPPDRALLDALLQLEDQVDLCIPRGGPSLIRMIAERSRIPVIKHYLGVCHLYVAADADLAMAERIALNSEGRLGGRGERRSAADARARLARRLRPRVPGSEIGGSSGVQPRRRAVAHRALRLAPHREHRHRLTRAGRALRPQRGCELRAGQRQHPLQRRRRAGPRRRDRNQH